MRLRTCLRLLVGAIVALAIVTWASCALADTIGNIETNGGSVVIFDERGPCVGSARAAVWIGSDGKQVPGCWIANGRMIQIAFADGDVALYRVADLRRGGV